MIDMACRTKNAAKFLSEFIATKANGFKLKPIIYFLHSLLEWRQFISYKNLSSLCHISKAASIIRDDPHHLWRYTVCAQQVVPAGVLDIEKVIFSGDFTQRQDFNAVGFTVRCEHKQVTEVV